MLQIFRKSRKKFQSTKELIEQIHNEFNIGGEKALQEAKEILSNIKIENEDKAARLKKIGFTESKEVKILNELTKNKQEQKKVSEALTEINFKYPNYKFITQKMADDICNKYNLVIGDISQYIGFVPEKNLSQIELFYNQNNELSNFYYRVWNRISSFRPDKEELSKIKYEKEIMREVDRYNSHVKIGDTTYHQMYNFGTSQRPLKIAAPIKDMDTREYKLEGNILKKEIPDPVVLAPIEFNGVELYCIVTAWGDEASDEIIVNQKNN
ncbi:MAG: hypothetical protein WC055_15930 [Melioribacteraceae bacterium]